MNRSYEVSDDDHQPLTWVQGRPLYAVHVIVGVLAGSILVTAILQAFGMHAFLDRLVLDSTAVHSGQAWRLLTYGFVNTPSISIAIDIVLLLLFGRDVERFLGRRSFLRLYTLIYLIPPVLLSVLGFWRPMSLAGQTGSLAIFVAFATFYPGATLFFNILASWAAVILVTVYTLMALAGHHWGALAALWGTTACAYAFVRHAQGTFSFALPKLRRTRPQETLRRPVAAGARAGSPHTATSATSSASASATGSRASAGNDMAEVDALLDKISRSGLDSLTPREHERPGPSRPPLRAPLLTVQPRPSSDGEA